MSSAYRSYTYLQFSHISGIADAGTCPFKLTSAVVVNNLSLAHNDLSDKDIRAFVKVWRADKPTLRDVTVQPGNPLITSAGMGVLKKFLNNEPESDVTTSSEESSDSESEAVDNKQALIVSKPPLPPRRSSQSTVGARSDSEKAESEKSESEKAESEKSESEKAESEKSKSEKAESETGGSEKAESEKAESEKSGRKSSARRSGKSSSGNDLVT